MNKKLTIQAVICLISKDGIGDIRINGENLNRIINNNLPEMKEYADVPARVNISIELLDPDLDIEKEGYANKKAVKEAF